ncbi:8bcf3064-1716-408a-ac63-72c27c15d1e4 [Sclerotinia trifoliorum]|uniref:8bcf3064-1716-408a-ac63-72c27c15d1e4 n=1 Tax=Sclerotinia trifoliorum TaxID=28548 RepID=A0A8H2VSA4_9HELO|nr:8bcf3064-1716-408a-ac63-72c27c15d1e4 [Sclerotinia trifoliorum]
MKLSTSGLLVSLAASVLAEDLLFVDKFEYKEFVEATSVLGYTTKVVSEAQWKTMTTAEFAAFKAIVIADPDCSTSPSDVQFLTDTKNTWGPAVQGNIVVIGTDPTFHFSAQPGAKVLIDNSIKFAASGKSLAGAQQTGLYYALSCYYNGVDSAKVESLSYFGDFTVRGNLACYNKAHIVASSPALGTLDDTALSSWSCSVHEAFSSYPSVGINGFEALAIAQDVIGEGSQTFGDKTIGLPYIISRGATPAGCGDGIWEASLNEECDDGNAVAGDGCSASCKCESGRPTGDGHCLPALTPNTTTPIHTPSASATLPTYHPSGSGGLSGPYGNKTVISTIDNNRTVTATIHDVSTVTTTFIPPYVTPSCPTGDKIVGVEIIVYVSIIESCHTIGDKTVTSYITSDCSTEHKPIWSTSTVGYPCYACALSSAGIPCPTGGFITATTTSCHETAVPTSYTWIPIPPTILPCKTCLPYTMPTCPIYSTLPPSSIYIVPAPTLGTHSEPASRIAETSIYVPAPSPITYTTSIYGVGITTYITYPAGPSATVIVSEIKGEAPSTIITYVAPSTAPTHAVTTVPVCPPGGCKPVLASSTVRIPAGPAGTSSILGYSTYVPFTGAATHLANANVAILVTVVCGVFGLMIIL